MAIGMWISVALGQRIRAPNIAKRAKRSKLTNRVANMQSKTLDWQNWK
jgi:membrane protein DedA with SNARE-associated domain